MRGWQVLAKLRSPATWHLSITSSDLVETDIVIWVCYEGEEESHKDTWRGELERGEGVQRGMAGT